MKIWEILLPNFWIQLKVIKHKLYNSLKFLQKSFLILLFLCFNSYAGNAEKPNNLVVLGKNNAPVKIKIFSSLTCPHCASFHKNVIPQI